MLLDQSRRGSEEPPPLTSVNYRGSSEPPDGNYNETNGLRRSRQPIRLAGITMGSTENVNDELASVFANRRRRRRSATPVKIGGIVMGDDNGNEVEQETMAPFGNEHQFNKRASYHPGMLPPNGLTHGMVGSSHGGRGRPSSIGVWGQRIFANGQSHGWNSDSSSSACSTLERQPKKKIVEPPPRFAVSKCKQTAASAKKLLLFLLISNSKNCTLETFLENRIFIKNLSFVLSNLDKNKIFA